MFDRLELLIGKEGLNKLKNSNVLVLGLGGVGGYVTESLVRSGLGNITIVDFDKIDITNLNRQIIATQNNIGKLKTEEFTKRILAINPTINIKCINQFSLMINCHTPAILPIYIRAIYIYIIAVIIFFHDIYRFIII